ncbi:MAG: GreA/GreB family elongation factor [Candidatus Fermentibacteraceae bacterium]|nr:GreA/GreB family elongation factor [Candidatus Fermentibacteraceae bacterium]
MSRLYELAESRNSDAFKSAWESALDKGTPVEELIEAVTVFQNSVKGNLPLHLAELAAERMDSENRDGVLEFASGTAELFERSSVIATVLVEALRDKYLMFEPLEIFITASGILSEKKPLKESWKKLKKLLRYQEGNFVYHRDFGPGRVLRVSRSSFTIDFQRARNHDMTVEALMDSTRPVSDDSLYVLRWKNPAEFSSLLQNGGNSLLERSFRDLATDNSLKEINLLKLLDGSDFKPRQMWKILKVTTVNSPDYMDMGDSIIPADSSSLLNQVEAVIALKKLPMSEKTRIVASLLKSASKKEESTLEQIFDRVAALEDIEKGAVFELAWLCSGKGKAENFQDKTIQLLETKAARVQRSIEEIHSVPCKKLYLKLYFASSPEEHEIWSLLDKLPRTMREPAADHAHEFYPELHEKYILEALDDPGETAHFMWALERSAKMENYMEPGKIVFLALKNLNFAKSEIQRRICMILMNKLRPQLEQHISLLDTRRLETLTDNLEQSLGAQETGLVLLARRELSGRRTGGFTNIRKFWESDFLFNSREGIARRIEEIEDIRTVQIPLAAKAIAEAASHGDLSENAEYTAALEKRDFLLEMLNRYRKQLKLMRPYPVGQISIDVVNPATRVVIESMGENPDIRTVFVVGLMDADADRGYINYKAPLGAALLGLAKGDTVQLPGSVDSDWRITEISLMEEKI